MTATMNPADCIEYMLHSATLSEAYDLVGADECDALAFNQAYLEAWFRHPPVDPKAAVALRRAVIRGDYGDWVRGSSAYRGKPSLLAPLSSDEAQARAIDRMLMRLPGADE